MTHVLEVRIALKQWNVIRQVARSRRRTFSTITRYCVLRLAQKCTLRWSALLDQTHRTLRREQKREINTHRHMVCLYGDDEKMIRLAAMDLGVTISAFVRLALALYLPTLAMEKRSNRQISNTQLLAGGIRFTETMQIFAVNGGPWPFSRHISCNRFALDSYW